MAIFFMYVLQAEEIRAADAWTLEQEGITALQLMERAATRLVEVVLKDYPVTRHTFAVLCGPGNNGGDGLVMSRLLLAQGANCTTFLLQSANYSEENTLNQGRLELVSPFTPDQALDIPSDTVILDALYGSGLKRALEPVWLPFIAGLKQHTVLSIDLPSGLLADGPSTGPVFHSTKVYTLQAPKLAFFAPENGLENVEIVDIGLKIKQSPKNQYIDRDLARSLLQWPSRFAHKGTFGHAFLLGGSEGMLGALQLSAGAALRGGCGLVSVYGPSTLPDFPPEIMVHKDPHASKLSVLPRIPQKVSAIGLGMGLGRHTEEFMRAFLLAPPPLPLVLDADALNHLAQLKLRLPKDSIITPHLKEFERLEGPSTNSFERWQSAAAFAARTECVVVLKGANTCIFLADGRRFYNSTGNYGMAKGGSGDVLTGLITALRAQGYTAKEAAILGVYLHGSAGDLAAKNVGPDGMCASDLIFHLPAAWMSLRGTNTAG